jgi:hypothetical protein
MSALKKLYNSYRLVMLIGGAMGASLIFYFIIVKTLESRGIAPQSTLHEDTSLDLIRLIVYGSSIMLAFVISFVRSVMLRSASGESVEELVNKLFQAGIITLAFCEVPAVLGLVLYFIGRMYFDFYILLALSLVLFFFYFPRYERWKAWMERKAGPNWEQEQLPGDQPAR